MPRGRFRTPATEHPGPWSQVCTGPAVNIVRWYPRWFPVTASTYSDVDVCELGRYYTYLDIWVGWVIRLNNKSGNKDSFGLYRPQHVVPPLHVYYSCTRNTTFNAHSWYIYSHTLIFICHLALTWTLLERFWLPWICMFRFQSLDWSGALHRRSSLPLGAGWQVPALSVPDSSF